MKEGCFKIFGILLAGVFGLSNVYAVDKNQNVKDFLVVSSIMLKSKHMGDINWFILLSIYKEMQKYPKYNEFFYSSWESLLTTDNGLYRMSRSDLKIGRNLYIYRIIKYDNGKNCIEGSSPVDEFSGSKRAYYRIVSPIYRVRKGSCPKISN
jgi:hypothetical protein